jgi:hypothetical protein
MSATLITVVVMAVRLQSKTFDYRLDQGLRDIWYA